MPYEKLARFDLNLYTYIVQPWKGIIVVRELLVNEMNDRQACPNGQELGLYNRGATILDLPAEKRNACAGLKRELVTFVFDIRRPTRRLILLE